MPVKNERYEYNCAQWVRLPGPNEAIVEDPLEELEAARYFDDPVATAGAIGSTEGLYMSIMYLSDQNALILYFQLLSASK